MPVLESHTSNLRCCCPDRQSLYGADQELGRRWPANTGCCMVFFGLLVSFLGPFIVLQVCHARAPSHYQSKRDLHRYRAER